MGWWLGGIFGHGMEIWGWGPVFSGLGRGGKGGWYMGDGITTGIGWKGGLICWVRRYVGR